MSKWKTYETRGIAWLLLLLAAGIAGYQIFVALNAVLGGSYGTRPCLLVLGILAVVTVYLAAKRKLTEGAAVLLIFASSLALKIDYVYYTSCYMRQQDTLLFDYPMGHLGYIGYLFYNHHLPDFDTRTAWSFSHPPLHHAVSAIWVKISMKLGMDIDMAIENIQMLTLFYSCGILLFLYLILKELDIRGRALYAILLIAAFHPTFILMSGSVNNDVLSVMFLTGALLYTIRWYKDSSMKNILVLALMIGFAMMSKVSTGLIAPAVAVVFLVKLVREFQRAGRDGRTKKECFILCVRRYFGQFAAFGVLVFPLGLWYPIRNKLLFGVPLNYAEKLKLTDPQYIGDVPLIRRFTDFSAYQLEHLNVQFEEAGTYREFNVFLGLLKTTIFGYFDFYLETPVMTAMGTALFWLNVVLVVISVYAGIRCLTKYRKGLPVEKGFFLLLFVTFMISYFQFCIGYPHICTMNVRYIIPVLLVGLVFMGLWAQEHKAAGTIKGNKGAGLPETVLLGIAALWAVLSAVMFLVLGTL